MTRRINILADKSLLSAFAEGTHQITAKEVRAAIRDSDFSTATGGQQQSRQRMAAVIAAVLTIAIVLAFISFKSFSGATSSASPVSPAVAAAPNLPLASSVVVAPSTPQPANQSRAPTIAAPITAETSPPAPLPAAKPSASVTEQALARGQTWLAISPDEHWFLQLLTVGEGESARVETYLKRLAKTENSEAIRAYRSDLSGKLRYGVIFGDYPDSASAKSP